VVRLHRHGEAGAGDPLPYAVARTDSLEVNGDILSRICAQLQSISGVAASAEQMGEALWNAALPGERLGGQLNGSFYRNATLVKAKADRASAT
jgi:hypothetical protein